MGLRPFLLQPVYKEKPWGGDTLARLYGRSQPFARTGESWELSCHPHGTSMAADGPFAGLPLTEVIDRDRAAVLGERDAGLARFPLLIKFLDIRDLLSVQVHPDDIYAASHEQGDPGKTEAWYVLEAGPDACIYMGLIPGVDRSAVERAIREDTLSQLMRRVPVEKGDLIFIAAGTVHTASGVFLCEVQQNSDTTYRVYDWQRVEPDGTTRPLHIEKALDVIDYSGRPIRPVRGISHAGEGYVRTLYASCPYFTMEEISVSALYADDTGGTAFHSLSLVEGEGCLLWGDTRIPVPTGRTVFVPAAAGPYTLTGKGVWIKAYRPAPREIVSLLHSWGVDAPGDAVAGLTAGTEGL
jgi:mannose-6-phosphate isomerase